MPRRRGVSVGGMIVEGAVSKETILQSFDFYQRAAEMECYAITQAAHAVRLEEEVINGAD